MNDLTDMFQLKVENTFCEDRSIEVEKLLIYDAGRPRIELKNDPGIEKVVGITLNGLRYWFYGIGEARTSGKSESRITNVLEFKPLHPTADLFINELYMLVDSQGVTEQGGVDVHDFWFTGAHVPTIGFHITRTIYALDANEINTRISAKAEQMIFHMLDIRRRELTGRKGRYSALSDFLADKYDARKR